MKKLNLEWFQAALIRAVKTIAQTVVGMITVGAAFSEINWGYIWSVAAVAGILSLLTSVAGLPETSVDEVVYVDDKGNPENVNLNALTSTKPVRVDFRKK